MLITGTLLVVLSAVSPIIVSYLTKSSWSSKTKQSIALLVTVLIAVIVAFVPMLGGTAIVVFGSGVGPFVESLVAAGSVIFTIQQVVFNFIFKDTEFATAVQEDKGVKDTLPPETDADGTGLDVVDDGTAVEDEEYLDPEDLEDASNDN